MTSILFLIETIYSNIFRWEYFRKKNIFSIFLLRFWNLDSILNIFKQKITFIADVLLNLPTPKNVVR